MADEHKTVEEQVAPAVVPTTEGAPIETKLEETAPVETAPAVEDKPAETTEEAAKEETKPVEEGFLTYKAQGLSFPK